MKTELIAVFFKKSGKWYATEKMEYNSEIGWFELHDLIKNHFKTQYKDLTIVVTDFGDYDSPVPIMITPEQR